MWRLTAVETPAAKVESVAKEEKPIEAGGKIDVRIAIICMTIGSSWGAFGVPRISKLRGNFGKENYPFIFLKRR